MNKDAVIGQVVAVDTSELTIELEPGLASMTRSTYEGTTEVGKINSYVLVPVGARVVLAMVTRVQLTQLSELKPETGTVALPEARRIMKATMIGNLSDGTFRQGISSFPTLGSPVHLISRAELDAVFGTDDRHDGFRIPVGHASVFPDFQVRIDPDRFFGKHAAVIGSTGSGKSCTIATLVQSVLSQESVKNARFVILDTNGEYAQAFPKGAQDKKFLHIDSEPASKNRLSIPYWFMDSEDMTRLFRAAPGVQRPVLLDAIRAARESAVDTGVGWRTVREDLAQSCNQIASSALDPKGARLIRQLCDGVERYLDEVDDDAFRELIELMGDDWSRERIAQAFASTRDTVREGIKNENADYESYVPIGPDRRSAVNGHIAPLSDALGGIVPPVGGATNLISPDSPAYFSKTAFRHRYLDSAISKQSVGGNRARENSSTMLMRIHRLLDDRRFDLLFGPIDGELPNPKHSLATFLRDMTGVSAGPGDLSSVDDVPEGLLPFYDRQRNLAKERTNDGSRQEHQVVVVDLSLLAAEILENVTALIGRLLLEALQRLTSKDDTGAARGEFPVVLVLEEAQNYIRETRGMEEESVALLVFERIAREGRKFGLGLVVASQRPSELSKTVLSQCNSFIVHRLQNPEDLRYFRDVVPSAYAPLLEQLPSLAPRHALVLGDAVSAPVLTYMREADPAPRSADPKFWKHWTDEAPQVPDFEKIANEWAGGDDGNRTDGASGDP